jgi:hypothetical protein
LFRIIIALLGFEKDADLRNEVYNPDQTHQNHKASREEVHDEFKGIFQVKRADKVLDTEEEKKKRNNRNKDDFPPPNA